MISFHHGETLQGKKDSFSLSQMRQPKVRWEGVGCPRSQLAESRCKLCNVDPKMYLVLCSKFSSISPFPLLPRKKIDMINKSLCQIISMFYLQTVPCDRSRCVFFSRGVVSMRETWWKSRIFPMKSAWPLITYRFNRISFHVIYSTERLISNVTWIVVHLPMQLKMI